jgi:error-prone DNA polymerase
MHPCGMVLSDAALLDRTPVEASAAGFPMTPFDKDEVEAMGLLKLDILGIRMQSAMAFAVAEVERVDGTTIELDAVPQDDLATFDLIKSTRTLGCFQIESPGQRELIGKLAPTTFDDLIVDISLFRPGPVKSDMVTPYLRGRHGWITPDIMHPDLEPVLAETYGVVVFHEQVMRLMSVLGGCTLAQADEHRRAMGKTEGHEAVRAWFYPAALRRGYPLEVVERVWDVLAAFASFGFCKAHAAAFALPTYHSAWLKTHHPAAFFAGLLTHDPGMYPKRLILDDARHMGIAVLPLDVNRSGIDYRVEHTPRHGSEPGSSEPDSDKPGYGIRLAFADVRGMSAIESERIVSAQPFDSLTDFWHRAGVSRPVVERLVLTGGFDNIHGIETTTVAITRRSRITRRDLLLALADLDRGSRAASRAGAASRRSTSVTSALRTGAAVTSRVSDPAKRAAAQVGANASAVIPQVTVQPTQLSFDLPDPLLAGPSGLAELTPSERVHAELEVLGLDASAHLIDFYRPLLRDLRATPARDLLTCRNGSTVLVAGVKVATQTPPVRSGKRVIFLTLDDSTGPADAAFFEDVQAEYAATLFSSWLLLIRGVIRRSGPKGVSIRGTGAWELGAISAMWKAEGIDAVHSMLAAAVGGERDSGKRDSARRGTQNGGTAKGRRVLVHPSGFKQSPWADIEPVAPPTKLWHASPGSSGW